MAIRLDPAAVAICTAHVLHRQCGAFTHAPMLPQAAVPRTIGSSHHSAGSPKPTSGCRLPAPGRSTPAPCAGCSGRAAPAAGPSHGRPPPQPRPRGRALAGPAPPELRQQQSPGPAPEAAGQTPCCCRQGPAVQLEPPVAQPQKKHAGGLQLPHWHVVHERGPCWRCRGSHPAAAPKGLLPSLPGSRQPLCSPWSHALHTGGCHAKRSGKWAGSLSFKTHMNTMGGFACPIAA